MSNDHLTITDKHPDQRAIFYDQHRFKVAVCGRRWGKSVLGAEEAIRAMDIKPQSKVFIVCPTREMVKDLFWDYIKGRLKQLRWRVRINENELKIHRITNGASLLLKSADKPDRLRGRGLSLCVMDEYADMDATIWPEVIRPALSDTGGKALFIGTPKGRNHFYELFQAAANDEDWHRWQYRTIDSPYIPGAEIERAKRDLDERTFKQEYEADFVDYLGAAYCYYSRDVHCGGKPFTPALPIVICCDFNIDPCIWELVQDHDGYVNAFGEVIQRQTDIWRMCNTTKERLTGLLGADRAKKFPLFFYGDYTSSKRRDVSATSSSWGIIRDEFAEWNATFRLRSNPRVVDRVNAVNSRQRSADGSVRFGHNADCIELMKDFELLSMDDLMRDKGRDPNRTHASDAVGYYIAAEYPTTGNISRIL